MKTHTKVKNIKIKTKCKIGTTEIVERKRTRTRTRDDNQHLLPLSRVNGITHTQTFNI